MWFLRAWKIGELEQLAVVKGAAMENIDPTQPQDGDAGLVGGSGRPKSTIIKRLVLWNRV